MALLTADDAASARELAATQGVAFRGGTGSRVIDQYVTRIGAHRYQEIACRVQGRASARVIVAAAPAAYVTQTLAIETITLFTWTVLAAATPRPPALRQRRGALSSQPR